ncbi:MAG: hypothetical protein MK108_14715 [Mariniblastus sp.]|nr:hypothetical protein [Mariniblastus sp.]
MKGLLAPVLAILMTGMAMGQTNPLPTEPIAYSLPVSDEIIESLKIEGWRQADIEPGLQAWIWQVILRNPTLGQEPAPVELTQHAGIRSGKIHFLVDDEQLETIHQRGLLYRLKPEERGQFSAVVLVYESAHATVPMSPQQAVLNLPSPPANLALPSPPANLRLPAPPNSAPGIPPVDLASRINDAPSLGNQAFPGGQVEDRLEASSKTSQFIEKWSVQGASNGGSAPSENLTQQNSLTSAAGPVVSTQQLATLVQQNQAEAARLAQMRLALDRERHALYSQSPDETRAPIQYPTNQFPSQYPHTAVEYSVESNTDHTVTTETVSPPLMKQPNRLKPTALDPTSIDEQVSEAAQNNGENHTSRTNGFLWFMLLSALGLNVYLGWISRGFYVRYGELSDELKETFSSTV